jgi:hypothetical protein
MRSRWMQAAFATLLLLPALVSAAALDQWTYRTNAFPAGSEVQSVSYGAGRFVASVRVYPQMHLYTSENGVTWTQQFSVPAFPLGATVSFLHDRFVTVDSSGKCATSSNGLDWINITTTNLAIDYVSGLAYGNGTWVVAGSGSKNIWATTNFLDWSEWKTTNVAYFRAVTFGHGQFAVVGDRGGANLLLLSTNGRDWNNYSNTFMNAVTFGQGKFVGFTYGAVLTSPDGLTWATHPIGFANAYVSGVFYEHGTFIAVGSSNQSHHTILLSTDGTNWMPKLIGPRVGNNFLYGAAYGASSFVVVGMGFPSGIAQSGNVAIPQLHSPQPGPSGVSLSIDGEIGRAYRVESSTNLLAWETVLAYTNDAPRTRVTIPPTNAAPARFYRAVSP